MTAQELIVYELANELRETIAEKVIAKMQGMKDGFTLSGDDEDLNTWEEYCIDVQQGTNFSEVYESLVLNLIEDEVDRLTILQKKIMFVETKCFLKHLKDEGIEDEQIKGISSVPFYGYMQGN